MKHYNGLNPITAVIIHVSLVFIFCVLGVFAGKNAGERKAKKEIRQEAIKAGVARWVPDEDGSPKFEWTKRTD